MMWKQPAVVILCKPHNNPPSVSVGGAQPVRNALSTCLVYTILTGIFQPRSPVTTRLSRHSSKLYAGTVHKSALAGPTFRHILRRHTTDSSKRVSGEGQTGLIRDGNHLAWDGTESL